MKSKILAVLLVFLLNAFGACRSGTHTCTVSGLIDGQTYWYSYEDAEGVRHSGDFIADGSTFALGVDESINCGDIDVAAYMFAYNVS